MTMTEYFEPIRKTPEDIQKFLARSEHNGHHPNGGWMYDEELGWIHADAMYHGDGVDGSNTFYHHEDDGARRVVNHPSDELLSRLTPERRKLLQPIPPRRSAVQKVVV